MTIQFHNVQGHWNDNFTPMQINNESELLDVIEDTFSMGEEVSSMGWDFETRSFDIELEDGTFIKGNF